MCVMWGSESRPRAHNVGVRAIEAAGDKGDARHGHGPLDNAKAGGAQRETASIRTPDGRGATRQIIPIHEWDIRGRHRISSRRAPGK